MATKKNNKRHSKKAAKKCSRRRRSMRGGGWTDNLSLPTAGVGNQIHQQYSGPGKDCPGIPIRFGTINPLPANLNSGLPGTGASPASHPMKGGATQLGSGGPVMLNGVSVARGEMPAPFPKAFQDINSALPVTGTYRPSQSGGRYGFSPDILSPNGVGMSTFGHQSVPCELGSFNKMNPVAPMPNPPLSNIRSVTMGVQGITSAPLMKGGKRRKGKHNGGIHCIIKKCVICSRGMRTRKGRQSGGSAPLSYSVGQADMMRYNAPTAGYTNVVIEPLVKNNPYMDRPGYDARSGDGQYHAQIGIPVMNGLNQACLKTN
uniref:Uncharacterized protein n=1 Tax=viral metagenome TaxID=1070528 RepID=A0A6C0DHF4_9ZZZZ